MRKSSVKIFVSILIIVLGLSSLVFPSNAFLNITEQDYVGIEWLKPTFDGGDYDLFNSVLFISGTKRLNQRVKLSFEVPIANHSGKLFYYYYTGEGYLSYSEDNSQTQIGNPYIGITFHPEDIENSYFASRFGLRLPIGADNKYYAASVGFLTSYDRFEAFYPELWTVEFGGSYINKFTETARFKFDLDVQYIKPTESGADGEIFLNYSFLLNSVNKIILGAGFTGKMILTEGDLSLGERSIHQLGVTAGYRFNKFDGQAIFKIPADEDLNDEINFIYGLMLSLHL